MRIHWISVLPPIDIAPARLAIQALHVLSEVAEVAVWAVQECWDPAIAAYGTVRPLGPDLWRETNRGQPLVALIGEEPENAVVLQVTRHHVDLMVLHGCRFHPVLQLVDGGGWASSYGVGEERDASASAWAVAGHSPEILCHSERALPDPAYPARIVEQPPPFAPNSPWRLAEPVAERPLQVLVRPGCLDLLSALLRLLAAPPGPGFEVVVAGRPPAGLEERVAALCHWEPQAFHQLVDDLDRFDLAVLLDTGDAPCADQLALWSRAAPTVAPAAGWHRDQPIGTYAALRPGHELQDLEAHLRDWRRHPAEMRALGAAGRRHLELRHAPMAWRDRVIEMAVRGLQTGPAMCLRPLIGGVERELDDWATHGLFGPAAALRSHLTAFVTAASNDDHQEVD